MLRWLAFSTVVLLSTVPGGAARADVGATPVEKIRTLPGFRVELLYSVPAEDEGSWVALTVDPKGRLITSDQYGQIYRITLPAVGIDLAKNPEALQIESIDLDIGMAQGLLCAFDSLYISVNGGQRKGKSTGKIGSGLYRARDTNGDDTYDEVTLLRAIEGSSEHGPHGLALSPDGESIFLCAGNHTKLPHPEWSLLPRVWDEDFLLTRLWDARGHARGIMAPGGWICKTDPEGKEFELFSAGYRNQYDLAFSPEGELFTFDSDMEWDIGAPWYRPTRVNHVTSGSDFGWRSGTSNPPEYYADNLGSVVDIGPGSPTGVAFGTGAKFPEKYQRALYIADWSYGIVYAVHLEPDGSSYKGTAEKFLSAQPLPVTDMVVHPDGAMYLTIGGRQTQSGLYRVIYTGDESTAPAEIKPDAGTELRALRHEIEASHGEGQAGDAASFLTYLGHADRAIRFAARTALEQQPVDTWRNLVPEVQEPRAAIQAVIALARHGHAGNHADAIATLNRIDWNALGTSERLDLLRAYALVFIRLGAGSEESRGDVLAKLDGFFPGKDRRINRELAAQLVYLEAPGIADRILTQITSAGTQEDQIQYAFLLTDLDTGWKPELRDAYFQWFNEAAAHRGGMSFGGFLTNIRDLAIAALPIDEKERLQPILEAKITPIDPLAELKARPLVKKWTLDELLPIVDAELRGRSFENGRKMFSVAACFRCHRVQGEGGSIGPDLTGAGGRFNHQNLLESLLEPNKVISDQYEMTQFVLEDGKVIVGRVINLNNDNMNVLTDMFDPSALASVKRGDVELMQPSKTSMMPESLLDRLTEEEILDLVAYLKSGGNPEHEAFAAPMQTTRSGLQYRILREGQGQPPGPTSTVVCHYRGWLDNGQEFDSSYQRGEPIDFPLNGVIAGWTEGLQLVAPGGKIELTIPSKLGYGQRGAPPSIPGDATLHFEVELIEVR